MASCSGNVYGHVFKASLIGRNILTFGIDDDICLEYIFRIKGKSHLLTSDFSWNNIAEHECKSQIYSLP